MSHRRRAVLLGALAVALGAAAASDVAGREAALRRGLGPLVPVLVARAELRPGRAVPASALAVRRVPARYAPAAALSAPAEAVGRRPVSAIGAGEDLFPAAFAAADAAPAGRTLRRGERVVSIVAIAPPGMVQAGSRVDVVVTRARPDGTHGTAAVALQDVEVVAAGAAPEDPAARGNGARVLATLRVGVREAVFLTAAQTFARELRLLPRAPGDRASAHPPRVDERLR